MMSCCRRCGGSNSEVVFQAAPARKKTKSESGGRRRMDAGWKCFDQTSSYLGQISLESHVLLRQRLALSPQVGTPSDHTSNEKRVTQPWNIMTTYGAKGLVLYEALLQK
ncbi:hypothetical protein SAY87_024122 [Trapa incisa]|uniref:Uncharacterized protein n=1 Tax=Trapa incisa TaxID=236973 RepID=A0AAN7QST3_9MYRT|nr:hypothetical protein SAY87_024122 [Trapa incisa]